MSDLMNVLGGLVSNVVAFLVMLVLAVATFFLTVFVVDIGAGLAGYEASGDFVVLSATILVASTILAGIMNNEA